MGLDSWKLRGLIKEKVMLKNVSIIKSVLIGSVVLWAKGPLSHEVSFVESYSSSEVTLKSSGMGESSSEAITDLKKNIPSG